MLADDTINTEVRLAFFYAFSSHCFVRITQFVLFHSILLRLLGRRAIEFHSATIAFNAAGNVLVGVVLMGLAPRS